MPITALINWSAHQNFARYASEAAKQPVAYFNGYPQLFLCASIDTTNMF